jgi:phosphotransferase system lactose/cellobiose-specific IIB subunit
MKKALIICNAGMSSSVMAKKTTTWLKENGHDIDIEATTVAAGDKPFQSDEYDLILISPQIRMRYKEFEAKANKTGRNIVQVGFDAYAPIPTGIEKMGKLVLDNID